MLLKYCEDYYFEKNYNCSESIIHAANDFYSLNLSENDMKAFAAYGKGMQTFDMCGAYVAGMAVLSMLFVKTKAHESDILESLITDYKNLFLEKQKTTNCLELRKVNASRERRCFKTVQMVCETVEEIIEKYQKEVN